MSSTASLCQRLSRRFPRATLLLALAAALARATERALHPGLRAWRGAANGLLMMTFVMVAARVLYGALLPAPSWGRVVVVGAEAGKAVAAGVALVLGALVLWRLPLRYRWTLGICGALLFGLFGRFGDVGPWVVAYMIIAGSLAGAGWRVTSHGGMRDLGAFRRAVAVLALLAGFGALGLAAAWVTNAGVDPIEVRSGAAEADATVVPLALPDPGQPGPFAVQALTYGSGKDHRPEYGRGADWISESVDGSDFVDEWNDRRTEFWGFDAEEMPIQGRVWAPAGEGSFPLVLIVHGNHSMEEYSDPGYAYLGELLASRGMILVSVDENFVNGSAVGGLRRENDARGWLLLEHLRQWQRWNATPEHPFGGRVDMSRLALVGHSRGGEAVAVAAAFNRLPYYPDDATIRFDYGFDIGAVIAIAPVYGQYRPGGRLTRLSDVNYLSIHGSNDGDVSQFDGSRQFENVRFSGADYHFKATAYLFGANHGQFNTVWGDRDWGKPFGVVLNRRALIAGERQRQAAKVFISAFLEAGLNGNTDYLGLFVDPRRGADWLPDTIYITDFDDSRSRTLVNFDEDVDVTTATITGGHTRGENLSVWREDRLRLKRGDKETSAVYLGWFTDPDETEYEDKDADENEETAGPARYAIDLPADFDPGNATELFVTLTDAKESPEPDEDDDEHERPNAGQQQAAEQQQQAHAAQQNQDADEDAAENPDEDEEPRAPLDFTVRLTDAAGAQAQVPLSRFSLVQPQLEVQLRKGIFGEAKKESEAIPQRFTLPLSWFRDANPELDTATLRRIELVFDRSPEGVIALERLGIR